jgi:acetyl-CoA carboxylase carboxyltransferase component/pyruvate/2-oxoglutarate dehydrogenase complex dihydrolipoamide acyltransferase (E2) component
VRNGEPLPAGSRRLEVPVLVDGRGSAWAPGALDVTLRLQGRMVVAETPPPGLSAERRRAVLATAAGLGHARGQAGAVTVSFAADPANGEIRFLETVPRLPEAYAAVESLTGLDFAALHTHLSRGGALDGEPPEARGHAFQVCLSARDPETGFSPSPGIVETLRLAAGAGVRADPAVEEGDGVPGEGDPAIVRLTAWGRTRNEALLRLQRGLAGTVAIVRGGGTDKAFLTEILDRLETEGSTADPAWIDRLVAGGGHLSRRGADAALLAAAVASYETELDAAKARFYASAARGRPEVPQEAGRAVELWHRGHAYLFGVARLSPRHYRLDAGGRMLEVRIEAPARTGRRLTCGGRSWHTAVSDQGRDLLVEVDGIPHRISRDAGSVVRAPAPAVVVSLAVQEGETVEPGQPLAVLEAMKIETSVLAPAAGCVRKILVHRNAQVGTGAPLLILDPVAPAAPDTVARAAAERVRFDTLAASPGGDPLEEVRRLMLGYDVEPRAVQRLLAGAAPRKNDEDGRTDNRKEDDLLRTFVDFGSLFHRRPIARPAPAETAERSDGKGRHTSEEYLFTYLRDLDARGAGLPASFLAKLRSALGHYGVLSLGRSPDLEESLFRIAVSHRRMAQQVPPVLALLERRLESPEPAAGDDLREILERLIVESQGREPAVYDLARELRFRCFDLPVLRAARERILAAAEADLAALAAGPPVGPEREARIRALVDCTQPLHELLSQRFATATPLLRQAMLEVMLRRYYRIRDLGEVTRREVPGFADGPGFAATSYEHRGVRVDVFATHTEAAGLPRAAAAVRRLAEELPAAAPAAPGDRREVVADLYSWDPEPAEDDDATALRLSALVEATGFPARLTRIAFALNTPSGGRHFTFRRNPSETVSGGFAEERLSRGIHPMLALRLQLWRLANFRLEKLPAPQGVHLFHGVAVENPRDERLFALAEVRDLTPVRGAGGSVVQLIELEHTLMEALAGMRRFQSRRPAGQRLHWNRVLLAVWPPVDLEPGELNGIVRRLAPLSEGLGLEKVVVRCRIPDRETGELRDVVLEIINPDEGFTLRFRRPAETPLKPLREYARKVIDLRRRGLVYPYEIVRSLAPRRGETQAELPAGEFIEHDLDADGTLAAVSRPHGGNTASLVIGVIRNFTTRYPEGMARVILLSDPSRGLGSLAEPECRRILAGLDLAERMGVPVEWFAVSAGAKISMDSGTENMDWIARVLRRLITFTEAGGEVNIVVPGINVGAQPYWNAEATMLMHTRGILIMTPEGAMVLTGKKALDYSGGVSAEDNQGIGGYERIMGPNGQAQHFARDLGEACRILMRHYELTYTAPGERFPRPAPTADPRDRDIRPAPHGGDFRTVGEVFSDAANPGRKKPFEIRRVLSAVIDQDHAPLERWYGMRDAEIAVVWDTCLGGHPVCLLGFESKPLPRLGFVPVYGPDHWTGGTLFPLAAKKVARAINTASGNRPLVVLANLSGFDGSPESMRHWQLEYGAEIGRAVVNFKGPVVLCVVSRYHGGAFVVFSAALHDNMEVAALEGAHASVIGGAPAAAVVFAREVDQRTRKDPRIVDLEQQIADPAAPDKGTLRARLEELLDAVRSEKLGEVAEELDHIHSVERAQSVGSIHHILPPERLRPYLIEAVERGMEKELERIRRA